MILPIETISKERKRARDGSFRGGARLNSGRPKGIPNRWPAALAKEIARLSEAVEKLRVQRRIEGEHGERILARLVAIERQLGLVEGITVPKTTRRRPLGR